MVKNLPANTGDIRDTVQSLGQEDPLEEDGNPHKESCLGNPMDTGAWWAAIHGVTKESDTT